MELVRYSATGNIIGIVTSPALNSKVSHILQHHEIDQLLIYTKNTQQLTIYNKDGSSAFQCGNGLRALAHHMQQPFLTVHIENNTYTIKQSNNSYWVNLGWPHQEIVQKTWKGMPYCFVNYGNPHIITTDHIGAFIDHWGTSHNISLLTKKTDICLQTHERGAGWTQSCGSANAAAFAVEKQYNPHLSSLAIQNPGGTINMQVDTSGILQTGSVTYLSSHRL